MFLGILNAYRLAQGNAMVEIHETPAAQKANCRSRRYDCNDGGHGSGTDIRIHLEANTQIPIWNMSENEPYKCRTFVFNLNDPAMKLRGLASTAKMLPDQYLQNYLRDFTDMERYEEAAIIKKEIESRAGKPDNFKFYLQAPDGTMTEIKVIGDPQFPEL